jgi:hypothetical protein
MLTDLMSEYVESISSGSSSKQQWQNNEPMNS